MLNALPHSLPAEALKEIVLHADIDDERAWVPRGDGVFSLPLMFNVAQGSWVNLTRARGEGVISRHRHPAAVTGFTLEGGWGYLEHDWTAKATMKRRVWARNTPCAWCAEAGGRSTTSPLEFRIPQVRVRAAA